MILTKILRENLKTFQIIRIKKSDLKLKSKRFHMY